MPITFRFSFIVTFPELSIVNAFLAELTGSFVKNTILSLASKSTLASPSPNATTPSVSESKEAVIFFPTIIEFFVFLTVLLVPITKVFSLFSYFAFSPTNIHSAFFVAKSPGGVFPIIILSLGSLLLIEPLFIPVIALIIGFPVVPPEISIAEPKESKVISTVLLVTLPLSPPIIMCLSV